MKKMKYQTPEVEIINVNGTAFCDFIPTSDTPNQADVKVQDGDEANAWQVDWE